MVRFFEKATMHSKQAKNIGNFIVDFFIASKRIVIEIDGAQHNYEENKNADKERDLDFQRLGITVLRYSNLDINTRFNTVCEDILKHIGLSVNELKLN